MNVRILKKLIRTLQAKITCPGCGAKFNKPEQVQFRGYVDNAYFLQLNCLQCPTLVFATVMVTREKDLMGKEIEINREIDGLYAGQKSDKIEKKKETEPKLKNLTTDDIIDAHNFFERFDGDFETMFGGG